MKRNHAGYDLADVETGFKPVSTKSNVSIINADTSVFERQIDEMVYALYGLTEEEIAAVEGKTCLEVEEKI